MYNVIFRDEIIEVDDVKANKLLQAFTYGKTKFVLNGAMRSFCMVQDIKPIKEKEYPKLPETKPMTKKRYSRALKSIKKGFLKGLPNKTKLFPRQQIILDKIDFRISNVDKEENRVINSTKIFGY